MRIVAPPGVFRPRSDSWMLADVVHRDVRIPGNDVLDLCTGSGAVAVAAARAGARSVSAVDVSRRSVIAARLNARLNGVRVRALRGSLFERLDGRRFAVISANPPYLPARSDDLPAGGPQRAWDAGRDGRALIDRIAADAARHLLPGGALLLVHSSVCGVDRTLEALAAGGLEHPEVVERRRGALGPLLADRAEELERRGLLEPGERAEDVVVLRALAPEPAGEAPPAGRRAVAYRPVSAAAAPRRAPR